MPQRVIMPPYMAAILAIRAAIISRSFGGSCTWDLVAVAEDPPTDLVEPADGHFEIQTAVVVPVDALCAMPDDIGDVACDERAELQPDDVILACSGIKCHAFRR